MAKISDEIREFLRRARADGLMDLSELDAITDRIDAEHERGMADAYLSGTPTDEQMAEHGWVRKDKEHIISHATIEATPHIDWSRIAEELEAWCDRVDVDGDACEKPRDIAKRIRKLAAKEQGDE